MKTLINDFHNTVTKSKMAGYDSLEDLQYAASEYKSAAAATLKRLEKRLCPHKAKNCACSAFIKQQ
jgi:hypothetical protein